ncbi:RNA polymerase sigma factor [Streptosporangium sp. NPDC005286]|uniref:RNA polymerase sigma factor n=1 Tax=Streptosporangium sp. NPDC005286 TaxID=3154463 RepID=UPI0033ADB2DB
MSAETDLDDAEVIRRARRDSAAFSVLFDRHAPALHRYVTRRLGDSMADDIVAETFLTAFRRLGRYDTDYRDARPWLYGIAANLIGKHHRAEVRAYLSLARTGVDEVAESYADRVEARVTASAAQRDLVRALAALASKDREVMLRQAGQGHRLRGRRSGLRHAARRERSGHRAVLRHPRQHDLSLSRLADGLPAGPVHQR